ncbi:MAG: hypothetical protein KDG89_17280 [Geminicoccaceae bacterium]|nr:hypothetical protein [Geminicoccaceae bacterium]
MPPRSGAPTLALVVEQLGLRPDLLVRYGEAIEASRKLWRHDPDRYLDLVVGLLMACEAARAWQGCDDPNARHRRRDRAYLKDLPEAEAALKTLRSFIARHGSIADYAILHAMLDAKAEGFALDWDQVTTTRPAVMLVRLLTILGKQLRTGAPVRRGAFAHRMQEGCLLFPRPRDEQDRNLPDPAWTGLVFNLLYLIRRYTAGRMGEERRYYGTDFHMPDIGKPAWPVVIAFVDAALGTYTEDVKSAERRFRLWLKDNPYVQLRPWPEGEGSSSDLSPEPSLPPFASWPIRKPTTT